MKKHEISEILDSDSNLIGSDDKPQIKSTEINADGTTDHNARIGHQHYSDDFLGRHGYQMYEAEGGEPLNVRIAKEASAFFDTSNATFDQLDPQVKQKYMDFADSIISFLKPADQTLSESEITTIIEDVITKKKDTWITMKKGDNDLIKKNKIKTLFSDLSDRDKGDLIKQLK